MAAPTAAPKKPELGDRRVEHPVGKLLLQPQRDGERAAPAAGHGDVLAQAEDRRVAPHFLGDPFAQRFGDAELSHRSHCMTRVHARSGQDIRRQIVERRHRLASGHLHGGLEAALGLALDRVEIGRLGQPAFDSSSRPSRSIGSRRNHSSRSSLG